MKYLAFEDETKFNAALSVLVFQAHEERGEDIISTWDEEDLEITPLEDKINLVVELLATNRHPLEEWVDYTIIDE